MNRKVTAAIILASIALPAHAYVGPGLGVGVIGALVGLIMTVLLAFLGLFWYPIKRLFKKKANEQSPEAETDNK